MRLHTSQENYSHMETLGARLKAERNRLRMNQDDFAAVGGVKKGAQITYEQDKRMPDAAYLVSIATAGVDVLYILTGAYSPATLPADENALLAGYRSLDTRGKAGVLGMINGMSAPQEAPRAIFHGDVGQAVQGNITAPQTFNVGGKKKK